jgi:serine/threonine-protein kinase
MPDVQSLGKYEIRREIGRGAMGVVYEGYDPQIKRTVALKTVRADPLTGEAPAETLARFRREAQAAGRLNHPNIVSIYDFGEDGPLAYIAMEFVKGRELKECFDANERFRVADVVRIMEQILGALAYSHEQGVVHRDVKPANIFLLADGTVKVADFGIAHIEASNLTQVGTVLGTPSYMSPEQIMGLPVDGRSDLFSAGVILYQFLTGERPFAGSATTTMQKVLKEDPLPPSVLNVQVLPALDAVVRKALAKRADDRYQSAREFADAIRAAAATIAAPATAGTASTTSAAADAEATVLAGPRPMSTAGRPASTDSGRQGAAAPAPAPGPPDGAAPPVPARARNPALLVVFAAAAVAVGAAAWHLYQQQATPSGGAVPHAVSPPLATAPLPTAIPPSPATGAPPPIAGAVPLSSVPAAGTPAGAAPATVSTGTPTANAPVPPAEAGTLVISAVGLIDPSDPRYQNDRELLQSDLRADARGQAVAKAVGLLLDTQSVATNYDLLRDRVLAQSGGFIKTVLRESPPRSGKDGLVSLATDAVVDVKALQKALNRMSREERVKLIRASGDPGISVQIVVRDADQPGAPPFPSPAAENILKERIKSFGFRTWSEGAAGSARRPDFAVVGEAKVRKLSTRLEASGLVVTKFALTSWTVKCIDRATGEEIYHATTLPKGTGSWASEEEALKAIGASVADAFSRDFFLQHAMASGQRVTLVVEGVTDAAMDEALGRELVSLPEVLNVTPRGAPGARAFDLQLAGSGAPGDRVAAVVLKRLNAKLGQPCFAVGAIDGSQVSVVLDQACADPAVLSRLETLPPAGLYGAPAARQKSVIRNPETLRKLTA